MQELFRKYIDNRCSPEDVNKLLAYFDNPANETVLRELIAQSLESDDSQLDVNQWQAATEDVFLQLRKRMAPEKGIVIPLFKKKWPRIAAAVIIIVGGFSIYLITSNRNLPRPQIAEAPVRDQVVPGWNKAMLTLGDGSTIDLQRASKGDLSKQGSANLVKSADNQLIYKLLNEKPSPLIYNSVATPRGGQYELILSDGSTVWLNAASTIRFPVIFEGGERKVEIIGEAYFEVAKDAAKPFKVQIAGRAEVEVLGTHFDINSYDDEPTINATLLEGSIKVTGLAHHDSKIIAPGEQAQLNSTNNITIVKPANVEQAIAWKGGTFTFDQSSLETVLRQLARWYDVDVVFNGGVPQKRFTGEIQRTLGISQILKLLEKNGISGRLEGKKLIITN